MRLLVGLENYKSTSQALLQSSVRRGESGPLQFLKQPMNSGLTMAAIFSLDLPTAAICTAVYLLSCLLWRRYQSPLSDIPGPFLASCTRLWHIIRIFTGDINVRSISEHEKHGMNNSISCIRIHGNNLQVRLSASPTTKSVSAIPTPSAASC